MATTARSVKNAKLMFGAFVNVSVKMFSAARDESSGFNQVHQHSDGSVCKVSQQNFCSGCNSVVPYPSLSKGVEIEKEKYAVVEAAELKACAPQDSEEITIDKFVPLSEVDPIFFDASYFLIADSKKTNAHTVAYELLYQAMKTRSLAGVATVTMRGKMHNVFIRVYGNGLMLHTIFNSKEIRQLSEFETPRNVQVNAQHLNVCNLLIDSLVGSFDPKGVVNEYDEKVDALIEAKKLAPNAAASQNSAPGTPSVDTLMAALQASLDARKPVAEQVVAINTKKVA